MINLVNYLLLIEDIPYFTKEDVDEGLTPLDVYKICSCIRETFCLSYSIRKQNNLYLKTTFVVFFLLLFISYFLLYLE